MNPDGDISSSGEDETLTCIVIRTSDAMKVEVSESSAK